MAAEPVTTGALAARLSVSPASATAMIGKLVAAGLARREPYQPAELTEAGRREAALVVRKHRLIELFLAQVLQLAWHEVHEEAELLEHAVSERVLERLAERLAHPPVDVHGHPIPGPDGSLELPDDLPLAEAPQDTPLQVSQVADDDAELLRELDRIGLRPHAELVVQGQDPADGRLRCRIAGRTVHLGSRIGAAVRVLRQRKDGGG